MTTSQHMCIYINTLNDALPNLIATHFPLAPPNRCHGRRDDPVYPSRQHQIVEGPHHLEEFREVKLFSMLLLQALQLFRRRALAKRPQDWPELARVDDATLVGMRQEVQLRLADELYCARHFSLRELLLHLIGQPPASIQGVDQEVRVAHEHRIAQRRQRHGTADARSQR